MKLNDLVRFIQRNWHKGLVRAMKGKCTKESKKHVADAFWGQTERMVYCLQLKLLPETV